MEKEREIVQLTEEQISDLWNGIYFNDGDTHEIDEETFTRIQKINTLEYAKI